MFSQSTITAMTDIGPLVHTFAGTVGFTVTGTTDNPILQRPDDGSAISFELSTDTATDGPTIPYTFLQWAGTGGASAYIARTRSPRLLVSGAVVTQAPTKLLLFGSLLPEPWLAIVVCYGANLYRHLYLGHLEKIGGYTGGECISGSGWPDVQQVTASMDFTSTNYAYLFKAHQGVWDAGHAGGVNVVHADNPTFPFRTFHDGLVFVGGSPPSVESCVYGGFGDQINDGYFARAISPMAGANVLCPVNLYAGRAANAISALGRAPGLRNVRMDGLDPETSITIGSETWKVVPAGSKQDFGNSSLGVIAAFSSWDCATVESTSYVGYAYRTDA